MVFLASYFNTVRMVSGQKEPVIMEIVVRNSEEESILVSLLVKIPYSLGFDRVGLMRETRRRLGYIKPGVEKRVPITLYGKPGIKEGLYPVEIRAYTHPDKYDRTLKTVAHQTSLRVISP